MNDNDKGTPVSKSPFWRFSVKFYAVPGVAQACIELQDQARVDVNVLFFLLWNATQGRALNAADVTKVEEAIGPWREMTVVPIRNVRRALKSPPPSWRRTWPKGSAPASRRWSSRPSGSSRRRCTSLRPRASSAAPRPSHIQAAQDSVSSYQGVIGPFPPGPLETVLSAFAKFEASP